ncbi:MAG: gamma carbonic anhydrase family protein [Candidatus Nanoarchaeia archaeon]|nr:gamma carbonic anhydrase family protein [Candidatus Nanoarchaeia archaeon]MDD5239721.1 gamma carbonic anhydrase family protein [Candidatus Nanoarchaeia archaeon]
MPAENYIHPSAVLLGTISLGRNISIWPNAVLRADYNSITIGDSTNIQDNVTIHSDKQNKVTIGSNVSVGHAAIIHGCKIKDSCIIGMGAIIMDNAEIGENCIIAAGALVSPNKKIPNNSLVKGIPGVIERELTPAEVQSIRENAAEYLLLKDRYSKS